MQNDETGSSGTAVFLSLLLPGCGQIHQGHVSRGLMILGSMLAAGALLEAMDLHLALATPLWLWQVWDAS